MKTILLTFALGLSLNTADACPMADAAAFQEAAKKLLLLGVPMLHSLSMGCPVAHAQQK